MTPKIIQLKFKVQCELTTIAESQYILIDLTRTTTQLLIPLNATSESCG